MMISDLCETLAQFMPMKAVFILAADEVPGFFPMILVYAGPFITGIALVIAAAILAVLGAFAKNLALAQSSMSEPLPRSSKRIDRSPSSDLMAGRVTAREFSSFVLVSFMLAASAVVSFTFTMVVIVWITGSAIVLAGKVHRGSRRPPFHNGRVEFISRFKDWMASSALWATVGAAILSLLVDAPSLGITGILLGAVMLRRVQQVLPDLMPLLLSLLPDSQAGELSPRAAAPSKTPYDFLATPVGNRLLTKSLLDRDLESDSWQVIGRPDNVQITLLARKRGTNGRVVLRIFGNGQESLLENEYALRTKATHPNLFHHESCTRATIAGFPSLLLSYGADCYPNPRSAVTRKSSMEWQIRWEMRCAQNPELQRDLAGHAVQDHVLNLLPLLDTAIGIKGRHQKSASQLIANVDRLRELLITGPRCIHFGGPVRESNLIHLSDGGSEPIDTRNWGVGLVGEHWGDSERFLQVFRKFNRSDQDAKTSLAITTRFRTQILLRELRSRNLEGVTSGLLELISLLRAEPIP